MTWVLVAYIVALKLTVAWLAVALLKWRRSALAYVTRLVDANVRLRDVLNERDGYRSQLGEVRAVIGRRPPRRRWLAMARRVALVTTIAANGCRAVAPTAPREHKPLIEVIPWGMYGV